MIPVPSWLPLAALLLLVASSAARMLGLRRVGVDAFAVRSGDDAHAFLGRVFAMLLAATLAFCATYALRPGSVALLGPLRWPSGAVGNVIGWMGAVFSIAGAILASAAQFGMGRSWRIGVREDENSALVSGGIYRFSRNPIYAGMMGLAIGNFLIAPNAVTLALLVAGWIVASAQIRLEESFLSRTHGDAYDAYRTRTRRWL
jgi:protein-S-isoprenylcysteine O-methyltransferase Ste14